jgi:hypothetical protein
MITRKLLFAVLVSRLVASACAQGFICLDNIGNTSLSPTATSLGLFFVNTGAGPELIQGDFNAAFYGGTDSANLALIASFWGPSAVGSGRFGPGTFLDPTGKTYPIPGSTTSAFFMIQAWTGNLDSYAAAVAAGAPAAQSPVFINLVNLPPGAPVDFINMPAIVLSGIPEPSTLALVGVGGVCALLLRRWRKCTTRPKPLSDWVEEKLNRASAYVPRD